MISVDTLREVASKAFAGLDISDDGIQPDPRNRVHNWRNHVGEFVERNWKDLSERERLLVIIIAEEKALAEDWE